MGPAAPHAREAPRAYSGRCMSETPCHDLALAAVIAALQSAIRRLALTCPSLLEHARRSTNGGLCDVGLAETVRAALATATGFAVAFGTLFKRHRAAARILRHWLTLVAAGSGRTSQGMRRGLRWRRLPQKVNIHRSVRLLPTLC